MKKLPDAVDYRKAGMTDSDDRFEKACLRANEDLDSDKHFFERRAHRRYRIRHSSAAEIEPFGLINAHSMWLPKALRWFAAVRQGRTLKAAGRDWHDVAAVCERGHERPYETRDKTWRELAVWCRYNSRGRLNEREFEFVREMTARLVCGGEPTEKQAAWLRAIYARLGGGKC